MTTPDRAARAKLARAPLPQPGPVKASERQALKRARRPHSLADNHMRGVRRKLLQAHGKARFEEQRRRRILRTELAEFAKAAWHVLEPGTKLEWGWHLDVICDALERVTRGEIRRLLINVPPGHTKSLLVSVIWPAWVWLEDPSWRVLSATYAQQLSNRDAIRARDLMRSDWYRSLIPRVWGPGYNEPWEFKGDRDTIQTYGNTLTGERLSTSVGGVGVGFRGNGIIIDDPMNVNEWPTAEALGAVTSWFDMRMSSRLNDMESGFIVIIMQRLHEGDLAGHVLAQDKAHADDPSWIPFEHICLRSEYDPERPNKFDRRTERGELLFPSKFPRPVIERAKIQLASQFAAQHDQDPMPQSGGIFPMAKLRFWYPADLKEPPAPHREKDETGHEVACEQGPYPKVVDVEAQSWDCAFKDKDTSDFVAGQLWARAGTSFLLKEQAHGHFNFSRTLDEIRAMTARNPRAFGKYVEDKANGSGVMDMLKSEIVGLVGVDPKGGKVARARAVEPLVAAGNVWLPHPALYPWVHALLAEWRAFPRGRHDDQVDAATQALLELALEGAAFWAAMTKM